MDILQTDKHRPPVQGWLHISNISRVLLHLYIFTMPFVSAFAFTGTISLPLICAVFLFGIMALQVFATGGFPKGFIGYDLLIILLLMAVCVLSFMYNGWGNSKSLNHTVAYIASFLLFYVAVKFALFMAADTAALIKQVLHLLTVVTIINALYVNVEFILANFADLNLNNFVPRPSEGEMMYNPLVIELFTRARGFANESGVYTQMMELFSPLTFYYLFLSGYCSWHKSIRIVAVALIITSILFAASSAAFIVIPMAYLISMIFYIDKVWMYFKKKTIVFYLQFLVAAIIIIILNFYLSIYALIALSITDKMDSGSFDDRQGRIDFFYEQFSHFDILKKIIGTGPAGFNILGFDESKSIISLYFSITFELGFAGLLMLLYFILFVTARVVMIRNKIGFFIFSSLIAGSMHYYVIHNYWVPWFWFIAAFGLLCYKKPV